MNETQNYNEITKFVSYMKGKMQNQEALEETNIKLKSFLINCDDLNLKINLSDLSEFILLTDEFNCVFNNLGKYKYFHHLQ